MRALAILALTSICNLTAQPAARPLSQSEFRDLAKQCLPDAPISTLRAIARVESAYNPLAISINYPDKASAALALDEGSVELTRQPATAREAIQWTKWFYARGLSVSIGLVQINTEHLPALGLSLEQAFDPCVNLRVGWTILNDKYQTAAAVLGKGQLALHAAISAYNSGSPTKGFNNGYVEKVLAAKPPVSLIPLFAGQSIVPPALVPPKEDIQNVPLERETPPEDPNSALTRVIWSTKAK